MMYVWVPTINEFKLMEDKAEEDVAADGDGDGDGDGDAFDDDEQLQ